MDEYGSDITANDQNEGYDCVVWSNSENEWQITKQVKKESTNRWKEGWKKKFGVG